MLESNFDENIIENDFLIENFNVGDYVTVFYLRDETLEELRITGPVISKRNKNKTVYFKIFINNEIILNFCLNSPFIVKIINVKFAKDIKYDK